MGRREDERVGPPFGGKSTAAVVDVGSTAEDQLRPQDRCGVRCRTCQDVNRLESRRVHRRTLDDRVPIVREGGRELLRGCQAERSSEAIAVDRVERPRVGLHQLLDDDHHDEGQQPLQHVREHVRDILDARPRASPSSTGADHRALVGNQNRHQHARHRQHEEGHSLDETHRNTTRLGITSGAEEPGRELCDASGREGAGDPQDDRRDGRRDRHLGVSEDRREIVEQPRHLLLEPGTHNCNHQPADDQDGQHGEESTVAKCGGTAAITSRPGERERHHTDDEEDPRNGPDPRVDVDTWTAQRRVDVMVRPHCRRLDEDNVAANQGSVCARRRGADDVTVDSIARLSDDLDLGGHLQPRLSDELETGTARADQPGGRG